MTNTKLLDGERSFKTPMSFGLKIEGRSIARHLGPVFLSKKAGVKFLGGRLNDQLETELDAGFEALHAKATARGGNAVINLAFRILESTPYYMMWGDAVILEKHEV